MKNSIKSAFCKFGLMLFLMMVSITGKAQVNGGQYSMSIGTVTATANTIDVDLVVTVLAPSAGMRFSGFSTSINLNPDILNGGTLSGTYVAGTNSASVAALPPAVPVISSVNPWSVRLALKNLAGGASGGVDLNVGQTIHVGTYRIANTANWASGSAGLWLQTALATQETNSVVQGNAFGGALSVYSYNTTQPASPPGLIVGYTQASPLNLQVGQICATAGSAVVTNPACGGTGSAVITMSPVPTVSSISYQVDGGLAQSATLSSGAFTVSGLSDGEHTITVLNSGCGNVNVPLTVTVPGPSSNTTVATACESYVWSVNGQTYTASGNFSVDTGCTIEYLELTINGTSHTTTASACDSYTWAGPLGNGTTYTESGIYTSVTPNSSGCNHTETLNLTINHTITTQPSAATVCATAGSSVSFSVVTNAASPTYTWQYRVVTAANPNPIWINITSANAALIYTNYTTDTLGVTRTSSAPAVGTQYRVLVGGGSCGTATSDIAALTIFGVTKAGSITVPASVCLNGDLTFTLTGYVGTSFQWQSAPVSTGVFVNIAGATSSTYTLTGATPLIDKSYRVVVSNSYCGTSLTSSAKTIKVDPTSVGGTVAGGGIVCSDGTASGTLKVAGYVGKIQWQYSTDGITYTNAPKSTEIQPSTLFTTSSTSSTGATYLVNNINSDLYFRARITSGLCSSAYGNVAHFELGAAAVAGTISADAGTICSGTGTTLTLSGSVGVITWYKMALGAVAFTATKIHTATYPTGNLTKNTTYKAVVTIGGGCPPVETAPLTISVDPLPKGGKVTPFTGTSYEACANVAKKLKVASTLGVIQWQSSSDNVSFTDIAGANAATYDAVITEATWFRVKATNGVCVSPSYSIAVQLTISTPASAGTIAAGASTICATTATTVALSGTTSGTLVWQKSVNFAAATPTWAAVTTGISGGVLTTPALTVSTAYRVVATSAACVEYSNVAIVTVIPKPVAKSIVNPVTVPSGTSATNALCDDLSVAKTLGIAAGYVGSIHWQKGTSTTAGFADIAGEEGTTYTVSNPTVGANYYRIRFSNNTCTDAYSAVVTIWYKTCAITKAPDAVVVSAVRPSFGVVAYPNPYSENFNLSLTSASEEKVGIVVYDMTGRLIERREVRPGDIVEQQIGNHYPSGVYNVVVTQGEEVKTLRVIKR